MKRNDHRPERLRLRPGNHGVDGALVAPPRDGNRRQPVATRPTQSETEAAIRTLIAWLGDDPDRTDLQGTPARVAQAYGELFAGYRADPVGLLRQGLMATQTGGQLVLLRAIRFVSFCEHHLLPFMGHADIGYVPRRHVVGLGSMAAAVDALARHLQIQERMTDELASAIAAALDPLGVAVVMRAEHQCLAARGACKAGARLVTSRQFGSLGADQGLGRAFFELVGAPGTPSSDPTDGTTWQ
jgi:GTP cyclohydrolase I